MPEMPSNETATTAGRLSAEQIAQYRRDGYTLFRENVLRPPQFQRLASIFEEDLARYGEANLDVIHLRDARLLELLLCDEVLDLVEPLVGPDVGLIFSHFICKPAGAGKATPWHEDSSYWRDWISTMEGICTLWLAIDEAVRDNGCMKVIPGSQRNGFSQYEAVDPAGNIFGSQIKPDLIDESQAVYFELQPNQCSLHEARIIHGAEANTSSRRRTGYTMRYFPTTSKVNLDKLPWPHKLWLARGRDRAGNHFQN